jgi:UDP-2-acetamido-3-amino-2,3-dideoxy-glucuronate N-acetyltransferase
MNTNYWSHESSEVSSKAIIGQGVEIWHNCQILPGAEIGESCVIGHNCLVGAKAKLGKGVKVGSNVDIWDLITLEDYVFIGPSVVFTHANSRAKYPKKDYPQYGMWEPILVMEGASIGANATIIQGSIIGKWAFVGAGAVVKGKVPDYAVVAGVPAKLIGWMCECGNKLVFEKNKAICRICNRRYRKKAAKVSEDCIQKLEE